MTPCSAENFWDQVSGRQAHIKRTHLLGLIFLWASKNHPDYPVPKIFVWNYNFRHQKSLIWIWSPLTIKSPAGLWFQIFFKKQNDWARIFHGSSQILIPRSSESLPFSLSVISTPLPWAWQSKSNNPKSNIQKMSNWNPISRISNKQTPGKPAKTRTSAERRQKSKPT